MAKYTYILSDFPNNKYDSDTLTEEINSSSITGVLQYINGKTFGVDIFFLTVLSGGDQTTLDTIISNHQGNPAVDPVIIDSPLFILPVDASVSPDVTLAAIDASGQIVNPAVAPVYYGQDFQFAESLGATTSAADTPQTKVSLVTDNLTSGRYKIFANWLFSHSSTNNRAIFDVTLNGTTILNQGPIEVEPKDTKNILAMSFTSYQDLSGINTILLQFWNSSNSTTISDASVEIMRVS